MGSRVHRERGAGDDRVDTATGAFDWAMTGTGTGFGLPAPDGTRIYEYEGCQIVARSPATGAEIWRRTIVPPPTGQCGPGAKPAYRQTSPTIVDGVVYATAVYDAVVALDAATGNLLWRNYLRTQAPPR